MNKGEIRPITMPGIHDSVYKHLMGFMNPEDHPVVLDAGAGHGAFSKRLHEKGYLVHACDMDPGIFYFNEIECRQADITEKLPFEDNYFDVVLLIEVMEHVHNHRTLFRECHRVLKPGGILFFSTPNIMSLKSRFRFLLTGFFYAFKPLDHDNSDGLQHVASLTPDQFAYLSLQAGFDRYEITVDRPQKTSRWLVFMIPLIRLSCRLRRIPYRLHNRRDLLLGRLLFFRVYKSL
jgi:SAM-dependent methyltransferase